MAELMTEKSLLTVANSDKLARCSGDSELACVSGDKQ